MTTRANIRTRPIGANVLSDKYKLPTEIETTFGDLALFLVHTGFTNIRNVPKDPDIIPIFLSVGEVVRNREIACGLAFSSLQVAWRLVSQDLIAPGNCLWYITEEHRFILYLQNGLSTGTLRVFSDEPSIESPFHVTFLPEPVRISIDDIVRTSIHRSGTPGKLFLAISLMMPQYLKRHKISRRHLANRISKLKREVSM